MMAPIGSVKPTIIPNPAKSNSLKVTPTPAEYLKTWESTEKTKKEIQVYFNYMNNQSLFNGHPNKPNSSVNVNLGTIKEQRSLVQKYPDFSVQFDTNKDLKYINFLEKATKAYGGKDSQLSPEELQQAFNDRSLMNELKQP